MTSLNEAPSFDRLPAWVAASIERGLAAAGEELDGAGWYKNNRNQLISELESRSANRQQAETGPARSENREVSDESAPSVESQRQKAIGIY